MSDNVQRAQIALENAVDTAVNQLFGRLLEIADEHHATPEQMAAAIAEFGGDDLADIYGEFLELEGDE